GLTDGVDLRRIRGGGTQGGGREHVGLVQHIVDEAGDGAAAVHGLCHVTGRHLGEVCGEVLGSGVQGGDVHGRSSFWLVSVAVDLRRAPTRARSLSVASPSRSPATIPTATATPG